MREARGEGVDADVEMRLDEVGVLRGPPRQRGEVGGRKRRGRAEFEFEATEDAEHVGRCVESDMGEEIAEGVDGLAPARRGLDDEVAREQLAAFGARVQPQNVRGEADGGGVAVGVSWLTEKRMSGLCRSRAQGRN